MTRLGILLLVLLTTTLGTERSSAHDVAYENNNNDEGTAAVATTKGRRRLQDDDEDKLCCGPICLPDFLIRGGPGLRNNVCGDNEEFTECGTACPKMCGEPLPEMCIMMCVEGCFCKEGYCRRNGACVREDDQENEVNSANDVPLETPDEEDKSCVANAHYNECGSYCPKRCGQTPPRLCPDMCVSGCECRRGYCLEEDGTCSPDEDAFSLASVVFSFLCPFN